MVKDRAPRARQILEAFGLDALVFLHLPNLRYLCGFSGSDGALVVTGSADWFLCDSRYTTQAKQQVRAGEIREYGVKVDGIASLLQETGAKKVGFEAEAVTFALVQRLREKSPAGIDWVPVTKELQALRAAKDEQEIAALERAAAINAAAFEEILPQIRPGVAEKDVALALEFAVRRRGGEEKAFPFIVASGPRGALPHGVAADRILAAGELITFDFGTRCQGYHSDETVTLALEEVPESLRQIYDTVLEAHDRALAKVRPGVSLREIDAAARDFIAAKGFGDRFGHGLGHGVGLEVHEFPALSPRSEDCALEGMVFTIEPGIYVPDLGGVRIEDMVRVTAHGCRLLTRIDKNFRIIPV